MVNCYASSKDPAIPVELIFTDNFNDWQNAQSDQLKNWLSSNAFSANSGSLCLVPDEHGNLTRVLLGLENENVLFQVGSLPTRLSQGNYELVSTLSDHQLELASIAWGLGSYQFTPYKKQPELTARLSLNPSLDLAHIENMVQAVYTIRDLINTPTEDMGPAELSEAAQALADEFGADFSEIVGDALLDAGYPCVHAVGRASSHSPRLLDIRWGKKSHPKVTLVGKGVCFDSGGLNLKPASGMLLMRKDMAGAAHVLGLARMIMASELPVRLRVIIPAVENSIGADAYRPGDILTSRKGLTIEITNTDAEGRLVLCDALAEASREKPDLLIDIATLTGAARVALGTDISAVFSDDDELVSEIENVSKDQFDPVWRLPMYRPYRPLIDSKSADIVNSSLVPMSAPATIAALFLREFVDSDIPWMHFDIMAWNRTTSAGRPEGGEAFAVRALYKLLQERYR